jgi:hypothetical protein
MAKVEKKKVEGGGGRRSEIAFFPKLVQKRDVIIITRQSTPMAFF